MSSSIDGSPWLKRTVEVQLIRRCGTAAIDGFDRRRSLIFGATVARRKRTELSISPGAVGVELMAVRRFGRRQHATASVRAARGRARWKAEHRRGDRWIVRSKGAAASLRSSTVHGLFQDDLPLVEIVSRRWKPRWPRSARRPARRQARALPVHWQPGPGQERVARLRP
jgi:hypothetical protein